MGWFGNEVGRAVARAIEAGVRSNLLLRRDADMVVWMLRDEIVRCVPLAAGDGVDLPVEAGFMLDRLAEIGLFVRQVAPDDPVWRQWFEQTSVQLADLEKRCEKRLDLTCPPPRPDVERRRLVDGAVYLQETTRPLAARALACWVLVHQALSDLQQPLDRVAALRNGGNTSAETPRASPISGSTPRSWLRTRTSCRGGSRSDS
jgi:hypothetical protein